MLPDDRIRAVQTGACPHTAIRDDISANLDAVEALEAEHPDLDLVLVESGGDNLTATFSYGLVHRQIFVIDVAGGDKVPRKGGPGVTRSDLLVINKTDLAPLVGADLAVMDRDAAAGARRPADAVHLAAPTTRRPPTWPTGCGRSRRRASRDRDGRPRSSPRRTVCGTVRCAPPLTLRQVHGDRDERARCAWSARRPGRWRATNCALRLEVRAGARAPR